MAQRLEYLSGKVYLGLRNASGKSDSLSFLGAVSEFTFSPKEESITHKDPTIPTRPEDDLIQTGVMADLTIILDDTSTENTALAFQGSISTTAGGTITDESHTAPSAGSYFELNRQFVGAVTSISPDPSGTAYVANTDYVANPPSNLIYVPTGSAMAGDEILVDYTALSQDVIHGFNSDVLYYYLRYEGINSFNMEPVAQNFYKVRFPPVAQTELISTNYQKYSLTGKCFYDSLNAASGGFHSKAQRPAS